jgi:Cytochrome c554 and c-prime
MFRVGMLAVLVAVACSRSEVKTNGAPPTGDQARNPTFTVFAAAELRGQIGPCGCTTDPLGDIARTTQLVTQARAQGPTLFVDAGSLLYSRSPIPPQLAAQEELKADLLAETYRNALKVDALGVGPADLPVGVDHLRLPRLSSNLSEVDAQLPKVMVVAGTKVGFFGVVSDGAVHGVKIENPVVGGKLAVQQLRARGAQIVVGLVQADSKKAAVQLVREIGGIDFAIAGLGLAAPEPERVEIEAQKVGDGWLVVPANRGQVISRLDLTVRGPGGFVDAVGRSAATARLAELDQQLASIDADLAALAKDPSADPAFVAQKRAERDKLAAARARMQAQPLVVPPSGNYFTLEQVRIHKGLACDTAVQDAVSKFYRVTGEANVKAAASVPVMPPAKGQPAYAGIEACADCHQEAVDFWRKTIHARAWKTLEDRGQQFDLDCIGCHVTGWDKPGGANLGQHKALRDVQCETCHGPGSIHVAKGGTEKPASVRRNPAEDLCASQCHTKEHSDTFELAAYLRDVLGPGHGEARRKTLGDGPTGAQLRKAGLDKAGRTVGAGCTR